MSEPSTEQTRELLDSLYRVDSRRILATLIRLLGDFDLAEEAMHEAFAAALSVWPASGVPGNPPANNTPAQRASSSSACTFSAAARVNPFSPPRNSMLGTGACSP